MLARTIPRTTLSLQLRAYSTQPNPVETALRSALKQSMKARESFRVTVIKSVISDLQRLQHTASPPSPSKTLSKAISQRLDAAAEFLKSTPPREDLAEQYKKEAEILREFVEESGATGMSLKEVAESVKKVVEEQFSGESIGMKDMGRVVKAVRDLLGDKAEGKTIAEAVKSFVK